MIKVVTLLFKRPDLSAEEFRDYYESHHRFLGEKYLSPHALKYMRRYPILAGDGAETPGFDVMMEVWFDNYYSMEAAMADMSCLLYTSPSPRDMRRSRMPSSA